MGYARRKPYTGNRFVRFDEEREVVKTSLLLYSKKKSRLRDATELIQFHWNFMDTIHDNLTPAMIESLSDYVWNCDDFLLFHYAV